MKTFLILAVICSVAVGQEPSLNCNYTIALSDGLYGCYLTINNPNGLNDFTEIGGTHLEGFSNSNVQFLNRTSGISTNVPSIICDTFPNLIRIELMYLGLTDIGNTAFGHCSRLYGLTLRSNGISSISETALVNLHEIDNISLFNNSLTTLPENVFTSQQNLTYLDLGYNHIEYIATGLFQPLTNLQHLNLENINLKAINNQLFINNANLRRLRLQNNNLIELPVDSFQNLASLNYLEIGLNPLEIIHGETFRGLVNLASLVMHSGRLRQVPSNLLEPLPNLVSISLSSHEIEELPRGFFVPTPNITSIHLWNNRLHILRRNSFGTLSNLVTLDLQGNIVNGLDRALFDDAINLNEFLFYGNVCASRIFFEFLINRDQYLPVLERCFYNFRYMIDTVTENDNEYSIFEAPPRGFAVRVDSGNEIQIALIPFNFIWNLMIEILIGTANNTRSVIRINQETNVVTVPTPNILSQDQPNDFRVTWQNQVILVYKDINTFPFMAFTMQDFFHVNFYGLRAVDTRASWSVIPFL